MFFRRNKYFVNRRDRGFEVEESLLGSEEECVGRIEHPFNNKLLITFWYISVLMVVVMVSRVFYLSVIQGDYYDKLASSNKTRNIAIKAPRGKIYDRTGKPLVYNIPSLDLVVMPSDLSDNEGDRDQMVRALVRIFEIPEEELRTVIFSVRDKSVNPVLLVENISQDEALRVAEILSDFPGLSIDKTAIRDYVDSAIFSHVLGYEGKIRQDELRERDNYLLTDSIGKRGIEKYYEDYLRGKYGVRRIEVDSLGRAKKELEVIPPSPGSDIYLNIDADLQKKLFDSISSVLEKEELTIASGLAMNPNNGEILALVNVPSYDNNLFSGGISTENYSKLINNSLRPMFNRAVSGEYPPGSTIKPLIAAAALTEGVIDENTQIESKGGISVGSYFFGDWKVHGMTDARRAIAVSSDVYFYSIGGGYGNIKGLGMTKMKKYEEMFGLGQLTNIDLPNEKSGFIPDEKWKLDVIGEKWYQGNSYHASIGQGYITTTPLQVATYTSAIANNGILYQPRMVSQIKMDEGVVNNKPKIIRKNIIDKDILKVVQEGMRMTVTDGTAVSLNELNVEVAGKTGTAQYGNEDKTYGWFVSYAPYDNPEIVLVVLFEGQTDNTYNAVPVTHEVYDWYFNQRHN
ncbi:penicillin-binding protein 2 [Patescibacteria group bacterium]